MVMVHREPFGHPTPKERRQSGVQNCRKVAWAPIQPKKGRGDNSSRQKIRTEKTSQDAVEAAVAFLKDRDAFPGVRKGEKGFFIRRKRDGTPVFDELLFFLA